MDLLHEIWRSNGRQVASHQHSKTEVGQARGKYYIRGLNLAPTEVLTVYLTGDEIDRLIAERRGKQPYRLPAMIEGALRGLAQSCGGIRESDPVSRPPR